MSILKLGQSDLIIGCKVVNIEAWPIALHEFSGWLASIRTSMCHKTWTEHRRNFHHIMLHCGLIMEVFNDIRSLPVPQSYHGLLQNIIGFVSKRVNHEMEKVRKPDTPNLPGAPRFCFIDRAARQKAPPSRELLSLDFQDLHS